MNFLKKIFKSKQNQATAQNKKQKTSFLRWLCGTKPQNQYDTLKQRRLEELSQQNSGKKSNISIAPTNNTKIVQKLSFSQDKTEYADQELRSLLITIVQKKIDRIQNLVQQNGIYGMINYDQPFLDSEEDCIWLKIGKSEQINSLSHIKPYFFDRIFMLYDQFGGQYSIEQILNCKQNICIKLQNKSVAQWFIDTYEKQFLRNFSFKPMIECFNKLKVNVIKTKRNEIWISFNQQTQPDIFIDQILRQIGFTQIHQEYQSLRDQIPKGLTLQEYRDIIQHKQKLQSKYQGQSVSQYIKNKFLQNISRNSKTPRNDSPRNIEKQDRKDTNQEQYAQYILKVTVNTLPRQKINSQEQKPSNINSTNPSNSNTQRQKQQLTPTNSNNSGSYYQQIFDFTVYKQERQQQAKRVAINKQRKKRSKSQDISLGENDGLGEDEEDYFDEKE